MKFRNLYDSEVEMVAKIHGDVVQQLLSKNIRQWMNSIPIHVFKERQEKNENFGLFDDGDNLLCYASISIKNHPSEWQDALAEFENRLYWLSSVFVNPLRKEERAGEIILNSCFAHLKCLGAKKIALDCVINNGFLVSYYEKFGFSLLDIKDVKYRSGEFKMALMIKDIENG